MSQPPAPTTMIDRPAGGPHTCPRCESYRVHSTVFTVERFATGATRQVRTWQCTPCAAQWVEQ